MKHLSKSAVLTAIILAAVLGRLSTAAAVTLPSNLKIMPLGDSITSGGGGTNAGYRGYLYPLLNPVAPGFQFAGVHDDVHHRFHARQPGVSQRL